MSVARKAQKGAFSKIFNALGSDDCDTLNACIDRRAQQRNRVGDATLLVDSFREAALDLIGRLDGQKISYEGRASDMTLTLRNETLTLGIASENRETRFTYTPRWVRSEQNVYIDVTRTDRTNGRPPEESRQTLALGRKEDFTEEVQDALESVYGHIAAQLIPDRNIVALSRLAPDSFRPSATNSGSLDL